MTAGDVIGYMGHTGYSKKGGQQDHNPQSHSTSYNTSVSYTHLSLRHSNKMNTDSPMFIKPYHAKDLTIDFSKRLILLHEQEIHLTPIEYKIVACLAKNSGKVVTYSSIMSDVWGPYTDTDNKILRVNMANIRRKLETNPAEPTYIFTELGVGYRMNEDESE